jgi:hypothetical protein
MNAVMKGSPAAIRILTGMALFASAAGPAPSARCADGGPIYGIHDFEPRPDGFLSVLEAGGARGTVTATEAVGHDATNLSGKDYRPVSSRGHTVIVRLNNGYGSAGTIPLKAEWDHFAARCAHFAAASQGATLWVIGNETNLWGEWPAGTGGYRSYISPEDYAACFRKVYQAIKAVRPAHLVIPQALAPFAGPYGSAADHDAMPIDHVTYMRRMMDAIRASGGVDGVAIHVPSRGYQRSDVLSTAKVNGNSWSFFTYKDWLERGIPSALWDLPVHVTESNGYFYWKGGHPEDPSKTYAAGWVQAVLLEIDRWNHNEAVVDGKPSIRCLDFYRWCATCDGWNIDGAPQKAQILADLKEAVGYDLRWEPRGAPPAVPFTLAIGRKTPPQDKDEPTYRGVWRSYRFEVHGPSPVPVTFELTGKASAGADDDDARLLVDADSPADATTWNTAQALSGDRDQGATTTVRFTRTLAAGSHVLRLQIDGTPFIETIEARAAFFRRGDASGDGAVDISDAVFLLFHLFGQGIPPSCLDAADSNDDGAVDLSDVMSLLAALFLDGPALPPPAVCGLDPTSDPLGTCEQSSCLQADG